MSELNQNGLTRDEQFQLNQTKYLSKQENRGMTRLHPFAPTPMREEFLEYAKVLREFYVGDIGKSKFQSESQKITKSIIKKFEEHQNAIEESR